MIDEQEALRLINEEGETAYGLLFQADPKLEQKFKRLDKALIKYLKEVKQHFPDAEYYTASGGFNLMLGQPHSDELEGQSQGELVAFVGLAQIGDGDF